MRRIQERVLGYKTNVSNSVSDIWLLGVCYKICLEEPSQEPVQTSGYAAFSEDFSSRILTTYRKGFFIGLSSLSVCFLLTNNINKVFHSGFVCIGDSKYTSDVNWGCMLRSSQMLVAQVLRFGCLHILSFLALDEHILSNRYCEQALLIHRLGRSWRKPSQQV